jgi:glyoxylase-like metal-dependent hydrolase (beta-lactamase superfamily II)
MHVERASEDIYIFTSERYAQVTASLIVSGKTGVLIDTMPFPEETAQIAMLAHRRCPDGVRYIIYTQHEADHVYGAYLFPRAEIIAHSAAREALLQNAYKSLAQAKASSREFEHVTIKLPTFSFSSGTFTLRLPGKTLEIFPTPGHTPDSVSVLLHEERLLFAGDTVMAVPTIANGNIDQLKDSLTKIAAMQLESIVQGHGEIILRGEIKEVMRRSIAYLDNVQAKVQKLVDEGSPREAAKTITIESCGLQRVLLNGVVGPLHTANVLALYDKLKGPAPVVAEVKPHEPKPTAAPSPKTAKPTAPTKPTAKPAPAKPAKKPASKPASKATSKPAAKAKPQKATPKPAKKAPTKKR